MESVDAIARKIVREALPCSCESCRRDRDTLAPAIASALRAERENTDAANAAAVNAYAKVRELEALLDGAKSALAAERAKFAAFAGPDGEPRNVLGTLPITADGAIAIPFMSVVYHPDHPTRTLDVDVCQDEVIGQVGVPGDDCTEWHEYAIRDCYSTRTAAEAAKEKEPNK